MIAGIGKEITVAGRVYRVGKFDALTQFDIALKLVPVLGGAVTPALAAGQAGIESLDVGGVIEGILREIPKLPPGAGREILLMLLSGTQRAEDGGQGWTPLTVNGLLRFQDMSLPAMLEIARQALEVNLGDFFAAARSVWSGASLSPAAPSNG